MNFSIKRVTRTPPQSANKVAHSGFEAQGCARFPEFLEILASPRFCGVCAR